MIDFVAELVDPLLDGLAHAVILRRDARACDPQVRLCRTLLSSQPMSDYRQRRAQKQRAADHKTSDAVAAILFHRAHRLVAGVSTERQEFDHRAAEQCGLGARSKIEAQGRDGRDGQGRAAVPINPGAERALFCGGSLLRSGLIVHRITVKSIPLRPCWQEMIHIDGGSDGLNGWQLLLGKDYRSFSMNMAHLDALRKRGG